jgi:hypothetical protein
MWSMVMNLDGTRAKNDYAGGGQQQVHLSTVAASGLEDY